MKPEDAIRTLKRERDRWPSDSLVHQAIAAGMNAIAKVDRINAVGNLIEHEDLDPYDAIDTIAGIMTEMP